jgi:hypothetical protein
VEGRLTCKHPDGLPYGRRTHHATSARPGGQVVPAIRSSSGYSLPTLARHRTGGSITCDAGTGIDRRPQVLENWGADAPIRVRKPHRGRRSSVLLIGVPFCGSAHDFAALAFFAECVL